MKGFLNDRQIEYVKYHLKQEVAFGEELSEFFYFAKGREEISLLRGRIVFLLSPQPLDESTVIHHESIPVLFPVLDRQDVFYSDEQGNIIFCHDLFKSAFYLLSGYQEFANPDSRDNLNRFSFRDSVQCHLNFIEVPVVNYYFEFIRRGLEVFCSTRGLRVEKRRLFEKFGFLLTHDIDKIDLYDTNYLIYKIKEIVGIRKSRLKRSDDIRVLFKGLLHLLGIRRANPYWNFDFMRRAERDSGLRSVFYFLDRGSRHNDAYYSFDEERMVGLFAFLKEEACEIGLHGTVGSVDNPEVMKRSLRKLEQASGTTVVGIRQHRLLWKHLRTAIVQVASGLHYDCTLGFAAHEGFRNSYCLPFKLYDFERDCMIDLWEFPLNIMDGTLFAYRGYKPAEAMTRCIGLADEIARFGGVLNILWHNSFFDDLTYPGVTQFYQDLLRNVVALAPVSTRGDELLIKMNEFNPKPAASNER